MIYNFSVQFFDYGRKYILMEKLSKKLIDLTRSRLEEFKLYLKIIFLFLFYFQSFLFLKPLVPYLTILIFLGGVIFFDHFKKIALKNKSLILIFFIISIFLFVKKDESKSIRFFEKMSRVLLLDSQYLKKSRDLNYEASKLLNVKNDLPYEKMLIFKSTGFSNNDDHYFQRKIYTQENILSAKDIFIADECYEYFENLKNKPLEFKGGPFVNYFFQLCYPEVKDKELKNERQEESKLIDSYNKSYEDEIFKKISTDKIDKEDIGEKVLTRDDVLFIVKKGEIGLHKDFFRSCAYYLLASINPVLSYISDENKKLIHNFFIDNLEKDFYIIYTEVLDPVGGFSIDGAMSSSKDVIINDQDFALSGARMCYIKFSSPKGFVIGEL